MNYNKWKQISDQGYSSDAISLLQFIKEEEELDEEHAKTQSILSLLERKQLIVDNKLTVLGQDLLNNLVLEEILPKFKKSNKFEDWWRAYPATDSFNLDGRSFLGSQSKRIKKDLCKVQFNKLVNEGFLAEDIIEATKYHIDQAKKLSLKKGTSQLTFVPNSERYLRESLFEPYIDLLKNRIIEVEFKSNVL